MEDFELMNFDNKNMSGYARTSCDQSTTANSEKEIIQRACRKESNRRLDYDVTYDENPFRTEKKKDEKGNCVTDIVFGFELKTKK